MDDSVMRHSMRYLAIPAVLACLVLSFWIGTIYGAGLGGVQYDARFAPSNAFETTSILRLLRSGSVEDAIARLENRVDHDLLISDFYDPDFDRWTGQPSDLEARQKVLQLVLDYQSEFPFVSELDRLDDEEKTGGVAP